MFRFKVYEAQFLTSGMRATHKSISGLNPLDLEEFYPICGISPMTSQNVLKLSPTF